MYRKLVSYPEVMTVTRAANEQLCNCFIAFYTYDKDMTKIREKRILANSHRMSPERR